MTPGTVMRIRTTAQLAVILDDIAGVPAGPDLAGEQRIPVAVVGAPDGLERFEYASNLEDPHASALAGGGGLR